jgi:hypothetical protein
MITVVLLELPIEEFDKLFLNTLHIFQRYFNSNIYV